MVQFLIIMFIGQFIVMSTIIFVLKRLLDRQLIETAIHKVETLNPNKIDPQCDEVDLIVFAELDKENQERIIHAFDSKIAKRVKLNVSKDRSLKGGMIIKFKDQTIDHSVAGRLRETGMFG